jgi:hypothetical protein
MHAPGQRSMHHMAAVSAECHFTKYSEHLAGTSITCMWASALSVYNIPLLIRSEEQHQPTKQLHVVCVQGI